MSKECIRNCPRIQKLVGEIQIGNMWSGVGPFHPDMFARDENSSTNRLLQLCESTYDCESGPVYTEDTVIKGFFIKRQETIKIAQCTHPEAGEIR